MSVTGGGGPTTIKSGPGPLLLLILFEHNAQTCAGGVTAPANGARSITAKESRPQGAEPAPTAAVAEARQAQTQLAEFLAAGQWKKTKRQRYASKGETEEQHLLRAKKKRLAPVRMYKCSVCQGPGHGKNNCPKNRSQRKERKCGNCGETKHNARTCTNPPLRVQQAARSMRAASAKASASRVSQMTLTQMGAAQADGSASSGAEMGGTGARPELRCGICGGVGHATTSCMFTGTRGTEAERLAEAIRRSRHEHDASTKAKFSTSWLVSSGMEPDRASALATLIASKGSEDTSCFKEIYGEKVTFEAMRRLQPGMWIEDRVRTCVATLYLEAYC